MNVNRIDGGWEIFLVKDTVEMIRIDYRLGLLIIDPPDYFNLVIESPFQFLADDSPILMDPARTDSLIATLKLLHAKVSAVRIQESGLLTASFENDIALMVEPDASYEAWELSCDGRFRLVCGPGGVIAVFGDTAGGAGSRTQ